MEQEAGERENVFARAFKGRLHTRVHAESGSPDSWLGLRGLNFILNPWSDHSGRGPGGYEESGEDELKLTTLATHALSFLPLTRTRSHPLRFQVHVPIS